MATDLKRPLAIAPLPEFAGILRQDEIYARGQVDDVAERINGWFDRLMIQSGVPLAPGAMLSLCVLVAVTVGGAAFVVQENLLSTAFAAAIGGIVPILFTLGARTRRQGKMLDQMPEMVGELARAARTGRSLEQCFELVAVDTPSPLGDELRLCARKMRLGAVMSSALRDLPERTGLVSLNVFVTALVVHQQTGGDLVTVMDRLARTIRDRLAFLGRLRAATIASRATAVLMLALPPAIVAFFTFRDPAYFETLFSSAWGRNITMLAALLQVVGSLWVFRILKNSQRS
jgi:tight adherence protein B